MGDVLALKVWDHDMVGADSFLGRADFPLIQIQQGRGPLEGWKRLDQISTGEIFVAIAVELDDHEMININDLAPHEE